MRTVHKVCTMLRRHEAAANDYAKPKACLKCPASEPVVNGRYRGTRACRVQAQEFVNIVKTGNPWGKKRCVWPPKREV